MTSSEEFDLPPLCKVYTGGRCECHPDVTHIDYRGWRFFTPLYCMACGVETCLRQWCYGRCCGPCDAGSPYTMRAPFGKAFAGKRELIDSEDRYFIQADRFIEVSDRDTYQPNRVRPRS